MRAVDIKRQQRLAAGRQAALRKIVAVHGGRQNAAFIAQAQIFLQALNQPDTARGHAHQTRRLAAGVQVLAQAVQQVGVQRLSVEDQTGHGRLLKNCSRMMQAEAASASLAPLASASVVL